tara:strand:+ start:1932 stop:2204 length:273 start_codon:yes stop_codon:yes gene_type:complete
MAKKKVKKSVKRKTSKKVSKKPAKKVKRVKKSSSSKRTKPSTYFVNLLFLILFLYGIYLSWVVDWGQGLALIAGLLLIIFIIRLVKKLKK